MRLGRCLFPPTYMYQIASLFVCESVTRKATSMQTNVRLSMNWIKHYSKICKNDTVGICS